MEIMHYIESIIITGFIIICIGALVFWIKVAYDDLRSM